MAAFTVLALLAAVVGANCQYNNYDNYNNPNYNPNYNNYNQPPYNQYNNQYNNDPKYAQDPILWRAHERTKYEAQLRVSCDTGDDRACFELFLSVHRMALYFTAAFLVALILLAVCIGLCCYCKRKRLEEEQKNRRFSRPNFDTASTLVVGQQQQHSQI